MILGDSEFHVLDHSSEWDFSGKALPLHLRWRRRPDYTGSTAVTPTITWSIVKDKPATTESDGDTLQAQRSRGVVLNLREGAALKAKKLHNLEAARFFRERVWQTHREPFLMSFMATDTKSAEPKDLRNFVDLLVAHQPYAQHFAASFGLLLRFPCQNIDPHAQLTIDEITSALSEVERAGVPVVLMLNVLIPPADVVALTDHPALDALCVSDNVPWGFDQINWAGIFGKFHTSPLYRRGFGNDKGEFSGQPLRPIVCDRIREIRRRGFRRPIIGCGGVHSFEDALHMFAAGANAVALDTAGILAPQQVADTISFVNEHFPALEARPTHCQPAPRATTGAALNDQA